MRAHFLVMFIFLSLCPFLSHAAEHPASFPAELLFQGKPIDPLCLDPMESANETIKLSDCGIKTEPNEKITSQDPQMLAKGFVGFDYDWMDEKGKTVSHGYTYYKAFKNRDNTLMVYTISSGGGSGQFSSLVLVKRAGDQLILKSLAGGDRCNNGIYNVSQKDGKLTYKVNMTPFDLFTLSKQNPHALEPYNDLAACASCCVGAITMSRATVANAKEQLISIQLNENHDINDIDQGKHQVCFNRLLVDEKKQLNDNIKLESWNKVVQKFNAQCV